MPCASLCERFNLEAEIIKKVLGFAVSVQQIPAPTFHEERRSAFIRENFLNEGLHDVSMDDIGNVYGRLPGSSESAGLVVSAHSDTVFPASTDLKVRYEGEKIYAPGIGDNSMGVAGLFGLLWTLRQRRISLPGDLWLVSNVGEEGLGDLCGMRAVVDRFGGDVLAYIVLEGMALGQVYNRGLGVKRYRLTVETPGGHSWVDYGRPSAVHELAKIINQLTSLELPEQPRTSLNVGVIEGGTTVNTIAAHAHMDLDLRSEAGRTLDQLDRQVQAIVRRANRSDVRVNAQVIGNRPAGKLSPAHPLVRLAKRCLEEAGIQPHLGTGSTDANIPLSRGLPAICIGLTNGNGAHTVEEYIHTEPLGRGLEQVVSLVQGAYPALADKRS